MDASPYYYAYTRSSGLLLQTVAKATSLCSCRKSNALCMISGDLVVKWYDWCLRWRG